MPQVSSDATISVPRWLIWAGSVVIVLHLGAVISRALAAPSGPWVGAGPVAPPQFAYSLKRVAEPYLHALHLSHDYRFASNNPRNPGIYFEARLKNEAGEEIGTIRIPEEKANRWVRHRQALLASCLGEDEQIAPPSTELTAPPGQTLPKIPFWFPEKDDQLWKREEDGNWLLRNRQQLPPMIMGPSKFTLLLAESYSRYLGGVHGAARVEIVRYHQNPIPPSVLFEEPGEVEAFIKQMYLKQASNFGEYSR